MKPPTVGENLSPKQKTNAKPSQDKVSKLEESLNLEKKQEHTATSLENNKQHSNLKNKSNMEQQNTSEDTNKTFFHSPESFASTIDSNATQEQVSQSKPQTSISQNPLVSNYQLEINNP